MARVAANISIFSFESAGLDAAAFRVLRFTGVEEVSRLFRFDLELSSADRSLPFAGIIGKPATLTITRSAEPAVIHGMVVHFEQAGHSPGAYAYRAVFVPRLWKLTLFHQSRIFQNMSLPDVLSEVIKGAGLAAADFRLALRGSYRPKEFVVQFQETDFDFISRLMEHEGLYYYFDHSGTNDVLVISDARAEQVEVEGESALAYDDDPSLAGDRALVYNVVYREQLVTGKALVRDYNDQEPDRPLKLESRINDKMPGLLYEYGPHYGQDDAGKVFAKIRNEELEAGRVLLEGASNVPGLRSGYLFDMAEHYRDDLNQKYFVTRVVHRGTQEQAIRGNQNGASDRNPVAPEYENEFTCIPATVQFRPARSTPVPQIPGVMAAKIETAGGDYAYVDEAGRYRAKLLFDLSDASGGNATLPIRMSQPYSGKDYGIHFGNHAGTEMVVAFVNGDVDRPLALGTVPNKNNTSPVVAENKMQNLIRTMAGNEILMDDTNEKSQVQIKSTDGNSVLIDDKDDRILITTTNKHTLTLDDKNENIEVKTKDGHILKMDDKEKVVSIKTTDGHLISVSDKDKKMVIKDEGGKNSITIDIGADKIIVETKNGNIDLHAPKGTIDIKAKALTIKTTEDTSLEAANFKGEAKMNWEMKSSNMTSEAKMEMKQKGGTNLTSEAGVQHNIKGTMVKSEGSAMNDVAGALVNVKASGITSVQGSLVKIN